MEGDLGRDLEGGRECVSKWVGGSGYYLLHGA